MPKTAIPTRRSWSRCRSHSTAGAVVIKARKGEKSLNLAAARELLVAAMAKVDEAIKLGYSAKTAILAWSETKDRVRKPRKPRQAKEPA